MGVAGRGPGRRRLGLSAAAGGAALSTAVFSLRNVEKSYSAGGTEFRLTVPHLDIPAGAKLAFVGESGSGKSTLLEMLAMILRPTASGAFLFQARAGDAHDIDSAWQSGERDLLADLRSRHIGYVLQHGGLLPYLTVRQNIELSRRLLQLPPDDPDDGGDAAGRWAGRLNIGAQLGKFPAELSVGQRQRVAIARALVHEPSVLIADEPTAAVDPLNAERIMEVLVGLVEEAQVTLIIASHAHGLMRHAGLGLIELRGSAHGGSSMQVTVSDAAA